jgi:leucyl-tRNA synthetase
MELLNSCYKFKPENEEQNNILGEALKDLIHLLNPFAPHITEELAHICGMEQLSESPFPEPLEAALVKDEILVIVQVNGKLRDRITFSADVTKEDVEKTVRSKDYSKFLNSGEIRKIIYVPGKLINIVG